MTESPVEQVRAAIDIVDLISQHVQLKKAGRTFKALCPFHTEKTPSFVVFPDTQRWHCFGCGEGGDAFSFLMKIENLTFVEALRQLADRIGIVLTRTVEGAEKREANKRLYAANEAAAVYYHGVLLGSLAARRYVATRGISDDTLREFLLGLAPDSYDSLQRHLNGNGYPNDELLAAGLLYEPENAPLRDRYRGRLMFPIRDAEGRIVSFGARGMAADAGPKYLNGPQTEIFDKGGTLYGLHGGAQAIKKEGRAVVVEGYVDVVIAHQADFRNVVATLGTAITERQLRQLARLAPEICLALDPDAAGENAALRGAEVAREALADTAVPVPTWRGLVRYESGSRASVTIAVLPDGKDPDELILEDPEHWTKAIQDARPVIDHALEWVTSQHDVSTAKGKAEAAEALGPLLRDIADPVRRAHYLELAAQHLRVDSAALAERVGRGDGRPRPKTTSRLGAVPAPQPDTSEPSPSEQHYAIALAAAAIKRGLPLQGLEASDFTDPSARALLLRIDELMRAEARGEWRPDVLELAADEWAEPALARIRELQDGVHRLTDSQLAASLESIGRQLHDAALAMQLREYASMAEDVEPGQLQQVKAEIARINRELASARRLDAEQPRGPGGVGRRAAAIPSRFRG